MPPANSPNGRSDSPLPPLAYLESPAPDLASTLHTETAEQAQNSGSAALRNERIEGELRRMHEEWATHASNNLGEAGTQRTAAAARGQPSSMDDQNEAQTAAASPSPTRDISEDLTRRERLQRVLARLNRSHGSTDSGAAPYIQSTPAAYGDRPPSPTRQSLYDWAPAYAEAAQDEAELESILAELRQYQTPGGDPAVMRVMARAEIIRQRGEARHLRDQADAVVARGTGETQAEVRRRRERERFNLRRGAVLQRARQEGSPSATDRMLRYVIERERSGMSEEEERAQRQGWIGGANERANTVTRENERRERVRQERDRQERVAAFRRGYLAETGYPRLPRIASPPVLAEDPATAQTNTSGGNPQPWLLENTLKFLSDLRDTSDYHDSVTMAIENSLATKAHFVDQQDDFVMDLDRIRPLAASSWLRPGAVFEGHQHATNHITANLTHRRQDSANRNQTNPQPASSNPTIPSPVNLAPIDAIFRGQESVNRNVEQINPNFTRRGGHRPTVGGRSRSHDRSLRQRGRTYASAFVPGLMVIQFTDPNTQFQRLWANGHPTAEPNHFDQWPVRFVLHSVDAEAMTLQGTMEAYDVPQHAGPLPEGTNAPPRAGKKAAPITTFVEGQIIDLRTHSFLTPPSHSSTMSPLQRYEEAIRGERRASAHGAYETAPQNATPYTTHATSIPFPAATAGIDALNWAHLPPFSDMRSETSDQDPSSNTTSWQPPSSKPPNPDTIAHNLLSTASLNELMENYIFMRWKERCFIHSKDEKCEFQQSRGAGGAAGAARTGALEEGDQDRGHGLTISGFYYVSLRRSDGRVEGLYFDPASTPHQVLRLEGGRAGVQGVAGGGGGGAWGFV
ncbi:hypothetical protein MBLNU230_g0363t1 [Neophaeotheca triangularis]